MVIYHCYVKLPEGINIQSRHWTSKYLSHHNFSGTSLLNLVSHRLDTNTWPKCFPCIASCNSSWRHGKMDKKLCSSAQLDSEETSIPENFNYFIILFQTSRVGETPSIQNPWIWENLIDQSYLTSRLSENSFFRCCKLLKPSLSAASFAGSWTGSPEYISGISGSGIWFHQDQFLSKKTQVRKET